MAAAAGPPSSPIGLLHQPRYSGSSAVELRALVRGGAAAAVGYGYSTSGVPLRAG